MTFFSFLSTTFSLLKSIEFHPSNHLNDEQTENSSDKTRTIKSEQTPIKISSNESESKNLHIYICVYILIG